MLSLSIKTAYDMSHSVCLVHFPPGFPGSRARMAICIIYHKSKSILIAPYAMFITLVA